LVANVLAAIAGGTATGATIDAATETSNADKPSHNRLI
jgi:hypothetical protein